MKHIKLVLVEGEDYNQVCEGCVFNSKLGCNFMSVDEDNPLSCTTYETENTTWIWKIEQE